MDKTAWTYSVGFVCAAAILCIGLIAAMRSCEATQRKESEIGVATAQGGGVVTANGEIVGGRR